MKDVSLDNWSGCTLKIISLYLLPQVVEDWVLMTPIFTDVVQPSSFVAAGGRAVLCVLEVPTQPKDLSSKSRSDEYPLVEVVWKKQWYGPTRLNLLAI